jgi:endonuclease/exonuclease/phosphatase family metal-dependent hydrolase
MKGFFKLILFTLSTYLLYWIIIIIINFYYDYVPKNKLEKFTEATVINKDTLKLLIWNLGYAGLGENMDFFYEGGSEVCPNKNYYDFTLMNIKHILKKYDTICDFILLQEVDFYSKRSYYLNQKKYIKKNLKQQIFSDSLVNYNVKFLPLPLKKPMGQVNSGLVSFSKYNPYLKFDFYFDQTYSFPKKLFFLDRGVLIHGYLYKNNKFLFVINIHLSAFDDAIEARVKEINVLKEIINLMVNKGHYVVVGGDWNINPPNFKLLDTSLFNPVYYTEQNNEFFNSKFKYAYDSITATNRMVNEPFIVNKTMVSTLDYYLCSKNINILSVNSVNLQFKHSDHNPVKLMFCLN